MRSAWLDFYSASSVIQQSVDIDLLPHSDTLYQFYSLWFDCIESPIWFYGQKTSMIFASEKTANQITISNKYSVLIGQEQKSYSKVLRHCIILRPVIWLAIFKTSTKIEKRLPVFPKRPCPTLVFVVQVVGDFIVLLCVVVSS